MSRVVVAIVLLLTFVAQAASAVHGAVCPMLEGMDGVAEGCEHCPPPPPEVTLHSALPECCVVYASTVETSVSEPVRAPHAGSSVALAPARVVAAPVAIPLARVALAHSNAPAPPPPPRNLPLLS